MKTTLRLAMAAFVLAALTLSTTVVQAQFNWTINEDPVHGDTVTLTRYTGPGGAVIIPDTFTGLPVTSIGDHAFLGNASLTSVTIPNSVSSIGAYAFYGCASLTNVTIGNSVRIIEVGAFEGCTSLTSVTIPASVTRIGDWAFYACPSLTAITVDPLNYAFSSLDGVLFDKNQTRLIQCPPGAAGSYTIPHSVTNIGVRAFYVCRGLTSVAIPNSVLSIGDGAFSDCTSLTSVTIPDGVSSIGSDVFYGCSNLTRVMIPASITHIGESAFVGCTSLTSVTIPDGVTRIGRSTFFDCTSLTSVTIPNSVTSIGGAAFAGCSSLTRVIIPASVTTIEQSHFEPGMFSGCTRLTTLVLPEPLVGSLRDPDVLTLRNQGVAVYGYPLEAPTHYVSLESQNPVPPFTTWDTAANVIQDAVDAAKDGDTVLVGNGVYDVGGEPHGNRVNITNSIRLESVSGPLGTAIVGATPYTNDVGEVRGLGRGVYLGPNAVLSGFAVTNGYWERGAGVYSEPSGVITNCVISGNTAFEGWGGGAAGGVYGGTLYNCTVTGNTSAKAGGGATSCTLSNCIVTGNITRGYGGGVYGSLLYNCTVTGNTAWSGGGARSSTLYNCILTGNSAGGDWVDSPGTGGGGGANSSALFNCTVTGNSAGVGGGAAWSALYNCVLADNRGVDGGGVCGGLLYNCTVTGNSAESSGGGGIESTLFNCIVYYNNAPWGTNYEGCMLSHCCASPGVGNIKGPPLFMDMAGGDYRLREDSPCIDAGTNVTGFPMTTWSNEVGWFVVGHTDSTDLLGNTRFIDGNGDGTVAWDIGAYEFNSFKPPRFTIAPQRTSEGWALNITGPLHKWVSLERSGDLQNWEPIWSGFMWEETRQVAADDTGGPTFYRMRVP